MQSCSSLNDIKSQFTCTNGGHIHAALLERPIICSANWRLWNAVQYSYITIARLAQSPTQLKINYRTPICNTVNQFLCSDDLKGNNFCILSYKPSYNGLKYSDIASAPPPNPQCTLNKHRLSFLYLC